MSPLAVPKTDKLYSGYRSVKYIDALKRSWDAVITGPGTDPNTVNIRITSQSNRKVDDVPIATTRNQKEAVVTRLGIPMTEFYLPTISELDPDTGEEADTVVVTVTGTNFIDGETSVHFGDTDIDPEDVTVNSATELEFDMPTDLEDDEYAVSVSNPFSGSSNTLPFTITAAG